jgi:hypothetical protein
MGYFFQSVTDLAGFLINQSEASETGRSASSPADSGFSDFESAIKAASIRLGKDVTGIENTSKRFGTHDAGMAETGEKTNYETQEPMALDYRTVRLLLSKSDSMISMEISSDDLALLLNKQMAGKPVSPRMLELLNPNQYQAKHRINFLPANLLSPGDSHKIPVRLEIPGLSAQSKYVNISDLISIMKDYPDPLRMEISIPLEDDPGQSLKSSIQEANLKLKAAFAFDLRQVLHAENRSDNVVRGLLMLSGKQYPPNINRDTIEGWLPLEQVASDDLRGSALTGNFKESAALPWLEASATAEKAVDLLKSPLILRRSALSTLGVGSGIHAYRKISNPAGDQTLNNPLERIVDHSPDFDEPGDSRSRGRLQANDFNYRLFDLSSSSKNILRGTIQGKGTDVIGESISSYAAGEGITSETPGIKMTEPYLRPILDLNELRSGMLYAARKNLTRVTMKLYPEKFGKVSVRLFWRGDLLSADLRATHAEAAKILGASTSELKSGLENAGLKVENINVIWEDGRENGAFGSSIDARSQKSDAELDDEYIEGNRRFSARSTESNRHINANKIMQASTHRGWIDLRA